MKPDSGSSLSLWSATSAVPKFEKLKRNAETDVCIVGGGITGLTCGYLLSEQGKKVKIIDDGDIGGGETSRTTAHLSCVLDDGFAAMEKMHGEEVTHLAFRSHLEAIKTIENIIKKENINCDFKRLDGYLLFLPDDSADDLEEEFKAASKSGAVVAVEEKSPLKFFNYPCLKFAGQGQFHVLKYISGLADKIIENDGEIFTHTHVSSIEDGKKVKVKTKDEHTVTANEVIVATNSPISERVATHTKNISYITYVLGFEVPPDFIQESLYWDTEDPYHYIRLYDGVLIVGGEDHRTGEDYEPQRHHLELEQWAHEHFDGLEKPKYKWSGQVMEPIDGFSFIGKSPENEQHVYIATGDSGMGMTHGTFAAIILKDLLLGRENPWAKIYDPERVTMKTVPKLIKEGVKTVYQYAKTAVSPLISPDEKEITEIDKNEGAIIAINGKSAAIFRDNNGKVHKFSALCRHLGCSVQWNTVEKTWDCPCHGSRYTAMGKVINGPALSDLEKLKS